VIGALWSKHSRWILPVAAGIAFLTFWEWSVTAWKIPKFVLPAPSLIAMAFWSDGPSLLGSLWFTTRVTVVAFLAAVVTGMTLGVLFTLNRTIERTLWPLAVVLQVTPVVAIAPLIIIWIGLDRLWLALLILAWIVAFFPILSNTTIGLSSADHGLKNLFDLYGASGWKKFRYLQLPSALPYILGGVRVSSGLALIGAVVAEFAAGSGSATGLAWRIIESGNMLNVPRMFAALLMLSAFGIVLFYATMWLQWALLHRWHESEVKREN